MKREFGKIVDREGTCRSWDLTRVIDTSRRIHSGPRHADRLAVWSAIASSGEQEQVRTRCSVSVASRARLRRTPSDGHWCGRSIVDHLDRGWFRQRIHQRSRRCTARLHFDKHPWSHRWWWRRGVSRRRSIRPWRTTAAETTLGNARRQTSALLRFTGNLTNCS